MAKEYEHHGSSDSLQKGIWPRMEFGMEVFNIHGSAFGYGSRYGELCQEGSIINCAIRTSANIPKDWRANTTTPETPVSHSTSSY